MTPVVHVTSVVHAKHGVLPEVEKVVPTIHGVGEVVGTGEGDSVGGDVGEADGEGGAMVGHMSAAQAVLQAVKAALLFQASAIVFFVQLVIAFAPAKALVIMPTLLMSH